MTTIVNLFVQIDNSTSVQPHGLKMAAGHNNALCALNHINISKILAL